MVVNKVLCLITGPSGSGKTCTALEAKKHLLISADGSKQQGFDEKLCNDRRSPLSVEVIHQDHYFTKPFVSYDERVDDSYENGSGIDWERLVADVRSFFGEDCKKEAASSGNENGSKVLIVEGHLLGDATNLFRQKIFSCQHVGVLVVFLVGWSQESCKRRRLARKKDRSEDEWNKLSKYIDNFVWPSFLTYGVNAMITLRQGLENTVEDGEDPDSEMHRDTRNLTQKCSTKILEIDNSEGTTSLDENADEISRWVQNLLWN